MKRAFYSLFLFLLFNFTLLEHSHSEAIKSYNSEIVNTNGDVIGQLRLRQGTEGVLINIKISGLTPGYHGMHFHKVAVCEHDHGFKSAMGHIDPDSKPHGYLNEKGPHEGNLPNLIVSKTGDVEVELYSEMVHLTEGKSKLLDEDGSSLIIHKNPDDHISQPIGGAGGRVACARIIN